MIEFIVNNFVSSYPTIIKRYSYDNIELNITKLKRFDILSGEYVFEKCNYNISTAKILKSDPFHEFCTDLLDLIIIKFEIFQIIDYHLIEVISEEKSLDINHKLLDDVPKYIMIHNATIVFKEGKILKFMIKLIQS